MTQIHPSAIVSSQARIAEDVVIGPFSCVSDDVVIESGCSIDSHVVIHSGCRIGHNNRFFSFCSIGADAQHLRQERSDNCRLIIGDANTFREHFTINKGFLSDDTATRVGSGNYFMAHSHFGHDAVIGDNNVIASDSQCAGHVVIGDYVSLGVGTMIHQYCHVGSYAMVKDGSVIIHDIPAFVSVSGDSAKARSINQVGMDRRGFSKEQIRNMKRAFRIYYLQGKSAQEAIEAIHQDCLAGMEVDTFIHSLSSSDRGTIDYQANR